MAITDIGAYCGAATNLQSTCDTSIGAARGIVILINYVQDHATYIIFGVMLGAFIVWLLTQMTK